MADGLPINSTERPGYSADGLLVDAWAAYAASMRRSYGHDQHTISRERWGVACANRRPQRQLSDDEFDDIQEAITNGLGNLGVY